MMATMMATTLAATAAHAATGNADKEAKMLFQRAEKSFNLGKFPEALADYQAAYEAKPLPAFLFNIAQCYRNMGNYERARFFYRRYLTLEPRSSNRRLVEDLIGEMTRLMEKQPAAPAATAETTSPPPATEDKPAAPAVPAAPAPTPSAADAPAATLVAQPAPSSEPESRPVYKRWWFWTAIGAAVAGGVVAAVVLTRPTDPMGSLESINAR
jgi:tetratricopeptide (TPR) repeat protein